MNVECIDFELGAAAAESAGHPDRILERDREEREREKREERGSNCQPGFLQSSFCLSRCHDYETAAGPGVTTLCTRHPTVPMRCGNPRLLSLSTWRHLHPARAAPAKRLRTQREHLSGIRVFSRSPFAVKKWGDPLTTLLSVRS